jgi:hypothetical protein
MFVLVVLAFGLALPANALAVVTSVTLQNTQLFRGYRTLISASKDSTQPSTGNVTIAIGLVKGTQTHFYTFRAASTALTMTSTLSSGTIRLGALGTYGSGVISFESNGALATRTCPNGGTIKTRPVERTAGSLTFSPTETVADRYVRSVFTGQAMRMDGNPNCPPPPPPGTCARYTSLSSSTFNPSTGAFSAVTATRTNSTATGTNVVFAFAPSNASVAPAITAFHSRTANVEGSRLTAASNLSTATLNMGGVTGWLGSLNFAATTAATTVGPSTCQRTYRFGTTTGPVKAVIDFVGTKAHNGSTNAQLERQRPA